MGSEHTGLQKPWAWASGVGGHSRDGGGEAGVTLREGPNALVGGAQVMEGTHGDARDSLPAPGGDPNVAGPSSVLGCEWGQAGAVGEGGRCWGVRGTAVGADSCPLPELDRAGLRVSIDDGHHYTEYLIW